MIQQPTIPSSTNLLKNAQVSKSSYLLYPSNLDSPCFTPSSSPLASLEMSWWLLLSSVVQACIWLQIFSYSTWLCQILSCVCLLSHLLRCNPSLENGFLVTSSALYFRFLRVSLCIFQHLLSPSLLLTGTKIITLITK